VGSSVNSWYEDLAIPALILKGNKLPSHLTMTVSPGSRQILDTIIHTGIYEHYLLAGARVLEPACGPCVGMGQAPPSGEPSVRTFNRNFPGRSGTINDQVYLSSPATAGATALRGVITDPRTLGKPPGVRQPRHYVIDDSMFISPLSREEREKVEVRRGPNIKPPPVNVPLSDDVTGEILIKLGDNISTGAMAPDGAIVMAYRSNVPKIAEFTFRKEDPDFVLRAKEKKGGFILAGENYGQGSSREHAALAPLYLGVRAVLAMSFARIHRLNLVHQGLIPLIISRETYNDLKQGDRLMFSGIRQEIEKGSKELTLKTDSKEYKVRLEIDDEERRSILSGGLLNYLKGKK
ncbi:MAG: aconitate hydratase, partial [Candidatus Omnitrophica bacterium]|nr:aconitate hydratase [Candidatus Omnitrophota bacterium]